MTFRNKLLFNRKPEKKVSGPIEGTDNPEIVGQVPSSNEEGDVKVHFPDALGTSAQSQSLFSGQSREELKLDVEK